MQKSIEGDYDILFTIGSVTSKIVTGCVPNQPAWFWFLESNTSSDLKKIIMGDTIWKDLQRL